jgi:trigger factor
LFLGAKVNDVINVEIRKVYTNKVDLMGMLEVNEEDLELQPEILPFTIVEISKKTLPELDQEFFDKVAGKDNIHNEEELREYLKNNIASEYENMSLEKLYVDSIKILKEKANITMPESFIEKYVRIMQNESDKTPEEQFESMLKYYIDDIEWSFIINSLLKHADFEISPEMIIEETQKIIKASYGSNYYQYLNVDEVVNYYLKNEEYLRSVINKIKDKKIANLVKENAKLNVIDVTLDEFRELYKNNSNSDTVATENQENKEEEA